MDAILLSSHYNSEWLRERIFGGRRPYSLSLAGKVVKEAIKSQASVGFRLEFEEFDDFEIFSSTKSNFGEGLRGFKTISEFFISKRGNKKRRYCKGQNYEEF